MAHSKRRSKPRKDTRLHSGNAMFNEILEESAYANYHFPPKGSHARDHSSSNYHTGPMYYFLKDARASWPVLLLWVAKVSQDLVDNEFHVITTSNFRRVNYSRIKYNAASCLTRESLSLCQSWGVEVHSGITSSFDHFHRTFPIPVQTRWRYTCAAMNRICFIFCVVILLFSCQMESTNFKQLFSRSFE